VVQSQQVPSDNAFFDFSGVSTDNAAILSCSASNLGCNLRGNMSVDMMSPLAFCTTGDVAWNPRNPTADDENLAVRSCNEGNCTGRCMEGCSCVMADGSECPTTVTNSEHSSSARPPALNPRCGALPGSFGDNLTQDLNQDYSDLCADYMSEEIPRDCECTFNFCNGNFLNCDNETVTCGTGSGRGLERCVFADRNCPQLSTLAPAAAPVSTPISPDSAEKSRASNRTRSLLTAILLALFMGAALIEGY
jgi:hypothetical protein